MDSEQPRQELVKCVLVGDNAVGKTRLICARAYSQQVSLSQLLNTHVPTVWAIDQYRIYKEVLENSWVTVDGVDVSLRLWDTFGDHHKDRRFAYGRSDVVLMCFDTGRLSSLQNCRSMWYNQIKRFCPQTPIILVGCKNDTRFIYKDENYLRYCKERSPLVRQVHEKDLVMPEQGRAAAKEMGLPYFETSVLTFFGVNTLFENAIRAALCARRNQRFWMTNLRRVMRPTIQEPFCPPRLSLPEPSVYPSSYRVDLLRLLEDTSLSDVIFLCGSVGISGHKFFLSAVSPLLNRLLIMDLTLNLMPARTSSETSLASSAYGSSNRLPESADTDTNWLLSPRTSTPSHKQTNKQTNKTNKQTKSEDTDWLLSFNTSTPSHSIRQSLAPTDTQKSPLISRKHLRRSSSNGWEGLKKHNSGTSLEGRRNLNHPAFQSINTQHCESLDLEGKVVSSVQTVITCTDLISPQAMDQVMRFLYTGSIEEEAMVNIAALKQTAEFLEIPSLTEYLTNTINKETFLNNNLATTNLETIGSQLGSLSLAGEPSSDVIFQMEDGTRGAHKPILMARCDMMQAMFSDNFLESSAKVVKFPGVSRFTFGELLYHLYSDNPPRVSPTNCLELIELANRLVLPRLITLLERQVIQQLQETMQLGGDVCAETLKLLQHCQIHNADQLSEWCLSYLAQNYNTVCRKFPKVLRSMFPENQAALNINRWPPIWYLKDLDLYQRLVSEQEKIDHPKYRRKRSSDQSGCLCFSKRTREKNRRR